MTVKWLSLLKCFHLSDHTNFYAVFKNFNNGLFDEKMVIFFGELSLKFQNLRFNFINT